MAHTEWLLLCITQFTGSSTKWFSNYNAELTKPKKIQPVNQTVSVVKKILYSFKTYLETVIQEGAQDRVEEDELKRGQGPYSHTRKKAVSMTAKLMVSNDPNLRKVRAINFPDINIDPVINRQTTWVSCILGKLTVVVVAHKLLSCANHLPYMYHS